jgi:hypothetical protein
MVAIQEPTYVIEVDRPQPESPFIVRCLRPYGQLQTTAHLENEQQVLQLIAHFKKEVVNTQSQYAFQYKNEADSSISQETRESISRVLSL